ncbi:metal-dependent hydrolase [Desulfobulbus rhabdoformis]|uniref:metal-dependent hydrolase n=1 Tax=Desulfobulbus rhabdoformis TaxID=34032 RepID=UPI0019664EB1|nr:metal-dependent hydrolase [Desulfobulbus rhabdoformis]MBM9612677.1 metal-dependent hydrolase [Desulfobulbus rhabdoformis]
MPGYKVHMAGGLVTSGLLLLTGTALQSMSGLYVHYAAQYVPTLNDPLINGVGTVLLSLFGALFPDTDTDSKGQNIIYSIFILIDIGLLYQKSYKMAAYLGLFSMLPALGHHRGWTHSWLAMLLVGTPIFIIPIMVFGSHQVIDFIPFYLSFTLGYLSHLVLDGLF